MQEVFEKIIEKLEKNKESFKDAREKTFCRVTETDDCDSCKADHYLDARLETINSAIEILKQAAEQYNNGWVLCSERLPGEVGLYIVCYENPNCYPKIVWFGGKFTKESHIIAWQPLPQPYQPKGE